MLSFVWFHFLKLSYLGAQELVITTSPFLPNNIVATNYRDLKLQELIEGRIDIQECIWRNRNGLIATIFLRDLFYFALQ